PNSRHVVRPGGSQRAAARGSATPPGCQRAVNAVRQFICCYSCRSLGCMGTGLPMGVQVAGLDSIDHVVLVMLENRSCHHIPGFLYPKSGNFDGLDGTEANPDADGSEARVFPVTPDMQNAYYFPLASPSEGYRATNDQLFSSDTPPASGEA